MEIATATHFLDLLLEKLSGRNRNQVVLSSANKNSRGDSLFNIMHGGKVFPVLLHSGVSMSLFTVIDYRIEEQERLGFGANG